MKKLLSLVLGVSIVCSSITPAMGQIRAGRSLANLKGLSATGTRVSASSFSAALNRGVLAQRIFANSTLQSRIATGQIEGLSHYILTSPAAQREALLRTDFVALSLLPQAVTDAQRAQAITFYNTQLTAQVSALQAVQMSLPEFLTYAATHPTARNVQAVQNVLADASALALLAPREQAATLVAFYQSAKNTAFADTAALIAARGCLRMGAYEELAQLFTQVENPQILAGTAAYVLENHLPVEIPAQFNFTQPAANDSLAAFLGQTFLPHELHADGSLAATREWLSLQQIAWPSAVTAHTPAATAVSLAGTTPLVLSVPTHLTQASQTQPASAVAAPRSTASGGIVYSGIPVFAIADAGKRAAQWLRRQFKKDAHSPAPYEEPGLHDRHIRPVYAEVEIPAQAQIGGDLGGADNDMGSVPVGVDGFKLTVEGEDKVEHILHNVDLTVSSSLKNFSPEYNRLALDTNHYFELRNQTVPAKRPDHFYFALSIQNGEFAKLIEGAQTLQLARPLRIKIQKTGAPKAAITLQVVGPSLEETALVAEVDAALLSGINNPQNGRIWYNGSSLYFQAQDGTVTELADAFIRLPKAESKYWTQIFEMYPDTQFNLRVLSTMDKMVPVTYLVPGEQIGLGKTLAPALHDMSTLGKDDASNIMLGINNVLPALMGLVHPLLKQYGEAAVFRVGAAMFSAGGLIALASGLYGHIGGLMTNWQLAGFLTSSVLIALGTNITRFVQNLLISANRGIVPQVNSFQKQAETVQEKPVVYNAKHLAKRAWEVATKKSTKSLRDVVYYQRGAMFKNLGTMLFLSFPWLANLAGKAVGVELGLDFSASYVPYTLYSLYTLRKVYKTRYKDAFPMNQTVLNNNLQDLQNNMAVEISKVAPADLTAQHPVLVNAAKQLKGAIDALVSVEARKQKTGINGLTLKHEAEVGEELENLLLLAGRTRNEAQAAHHYLQQAFDVLGRRDVKWYKVAAMKGLPPALAAMTLATFGELGLSNGLAFAMRELVGEGTAATGIVGILLYGCMFGWRIVGNVLSQRMSGGSMYALSSAASIAGPALMALAMQSGNMGLLVGGAITACFGISNFFSQMYEYMIGLYPKYKREIALLINYTMPLAALPVGALKSGALEAIPGLDMALCGVALAGSVALTPGMLANSSMVQAVKYWGKNLKDKIRHLIKHNQPGDNNTTASTEETAAPAY